jgi:hypothetical protein
MSLWEWGRPGPDQTSMLTSVIQDPTASADGGQLQQDWQLHVRFNLADPRHIITCGTRSVLSSCQNSNHSHSICFKYV